MKRITFMRFQCTIILISRQLFLWTFTVIHENH